MLESAPSEGAADHKTLPLRQMHLRMRRVNDTVKYVAHHLDVLWLQVLRVCWLFGPLFCTNCPVTRSPKP